MTDQRWLPGDYRTVGGNLYAMCECGKVVRVKAIFGTMHVCGLPTESPPRTSVVPGIAPPTAAPGLPPPLDFED